MPQAIRVGMAQVAAAGSPASLETQALGSCVAVVLYDARKKIGGLTHAMLPDIASAKESSRGNSGKFVDSALDDLIERMEEAGAKRENLAAKLVGGANMFPEITRSGEMHIGRRNVEAAKRKLEELGIPLIAEETGGNVGRTIILDTDTGKLRVKTALVGEKEI